MPLPTVTAAHGFRVNVVTSREEMAQYAGQWNELLADCRANSVFLTWQWVEAWLDVVYPQAPLLTVVVSDGDGRLVGIAPLYFSELSLLGHVPLGCLRILGDRHTGGEYPDFILRRGFEARALHAILRTLLAQRTPWHCIWLSKMAGWTGTYEFLRDACGQLRMPLRDRPSEFAIVDLPTSYDSWLKSLSHHRRSNLCRMTRQLFEKHKVRHIRPKDADDLNWLLEALFDLHQKHWNSVGLTSSFDRTPYKKPFYQRVAIQALQQGWLQLDGLEVDGQLKAVQYGYVYNGTLSSVQEGYDPESFNGIGNVLRHLVIQRAIADGVRKYDFLAGYTEHKQRWGGQRRLGQDVLIGRTGLRARLLLAGSFWPTGRFIKQGMPV